MPEQARDGSSSLRIATAHQSSGTVVTARADATLHILFMSACASGTVATARAGAKLPICSEVRAPPRTENSVYTGRLVTLRTRRDAIRPSSKRPQPCAVRRAAPSGRRFESVAAMPGDGRSCIRRFNSAPESASMAAPATGYKSIQYPPGEHPGRRFAWRPAASDQRPKNHRFFAGCRQRQRRKGLKRLWICNPQSFSR